MGSCGCAEVNGDFKLAGPDGTVYVLSVYSGCSECQSPAGVFIDRVEVKEDEHGESYCDSGFELDALPELSLGDGGLRGIPIVDPDILKNKIVEQLDLDDLGLLVEECVSNDDYDFKDSIDIMFDEIMKEIFQGVVIESFKKWSKEARTSDDEGDAEDG